MSNWVPRSTWHLRIRSICSHTNTRMQISEAGYFAEDTGILCMHDIGFVCLLGNVMYMCCWYRWQLQPKLNYSSLPAGWILCSWENKNCLILFTACCRSITSGEKKNLDSRAHCFCFFLGHEIHSKTPPLKQESPSYISAGLFYRIKIMDR